MRKSNREKELEEQVKELQAKIDKLTSSKSVFTRFKKASKKIAVFTLIVLCSLLINFSVVALWLKRNVVNTDVWTNKTTQLIQTSEVQDQISTSITNQLFQMTDVEAMIQEIVPPKASALAVPLTNSLENYTKSKVKEIVASNKFQEYWSKSNQSAHAGIIKSLENGGQRPDGPSNYLVYIDKSQLILNLNPIFRQIQSDLGNAGLNFVNVIDANRVNKTLVLTEIDSMPQVLTAFNVIKNSAKVIYILAIITGLIALYLADNKRKVIIALCTTTLLMMVLDVQAIYMAKYPLLSQLTENQVMLGSTVIDIMIKDLVLINRLVMTFCLLVLVAMLLTGNSRFAKAIQKNLNKLTKPNKENKLIKNLSANYKTYIASMALIYSIIIMFIPIKTIVLPIVILALICIVSIWLVSLGKDTAKS